MSLTQMQSCGGQHGQSMVTKLSTIIKYSFVNTPLEDLQL